MNEAIDVLKRNGAVVVDPANMPTVVDPDPTKNILSFDICSGVNNAKGKDENCTVVLKYGMKRDFNAYLATLGPAAPVKSLTELRAWNTAHARAGAIRYGQSNLDISDEMDVAADKARYEADRARDIALAGDRGFKAAIEDEQGRRADVSRVGDLESRVTAGLSGNRRADRHDRRYGWRRRWRRRRQQSLPAGLRSEAVALQRGVRRVAVQRTEAVSDCVRLRTGDEETSAAGVTSQVMRFQEVPGGS